MNAGGGILLSGYLVDNEGMVDFPVIGKVKMAGLSVFEAEIKMKEVLATYLRDPIIRIRLLNFRFTFVGEINRQVTSFNPRISMVEAIALTGGLPELADRQNIKIIRQRGDQADVYYVNLLDEAFVNSPYFYLQQNDIIVVSALKQRPFRMYWTENIEHHPLNSVRGVVNGHPSPELNSWNTTNSKKYRSLPSFSLTRPGCSTA